MSNHILIVLPTYICAPRLKLLTRFSVNGIVGPIVILRAQRQVSEDPNFRGAQWRFEKATVLCMVKEFISFVQKSAVAAIAFFSFYRFALRSHSVYT